jgi:hypothetical protein
MQIEDKPDEPVLQGFIAVLKDNDSPGNGSEPFFSYGPSDSLSSLAKSIHDNFSYGLREKHYSLIAVIPAVYQSGDLLSEEFLAVACASKG